MQHIILYVIYDVIYLIKAYYLSCNSHHIRPLPHPPTHTHTTHYYTVSMELNDVMLAGSMCVHSFVRTSVCVSAMKCTLMYGEQTLDLEAPIFVHKCMLTRYVHVAIFVQILNALDLHFNGQRFESSTLGSSHVNI